MTAFFLAACGTTTQTGSTDGRRPAADKKAHVIAVTEKPEAVVATLPKAAPPDEEAPAKTKAIPLPRKPIPEATVLMGKTVEEIEQVFGRPILQRKDSPAEIWQYLTEECALHLVFYPEKNDSEQGLTVQHVSMNERKKAAEINSRRCFGSQLRKVGADRAQALG